MTLWVWRASLVCTMRFYGEPPCEKVVWTETGFTTLGQAQRAVGRVYDEVARREYYNGSPTCRYTREAVR